MVDTAGQLSRFDVRNSKGTFVNLSWTLSEDVLAYENSLLNLTTQLISNEIKTIEVLECKFNYKEIKYPVTHFLIKRIAHN